MNTTVVLWITVFSAGCGLLNGGTEENTSSTASATTTEQAAKTPERVLYYQLSGNTEQGWQLSNKENLEQVEKQIVISSTILGFKRNLYFDRLVPFEPAHLKQESWHLITFEQGDSDDEQGVALDIQLEWLDNEGELKKVSVKVDHADQHPPSRATFDTLFRRYVQTVDDVKRSADEPTEGQVTGEGSQESGEAQAKQTDGPNQGEHSPKNTKSKKKTKAP